MTAEKTPEVTQADAPAEAQGKTPTKAPAKPRRTRQPRKTPTRKTAPRKPQVKAEQFDLRKSDSEKNKKLSETAGKSKTKKAGEVKTMKVVADIPEELHMKFAFKVKYSPEGPRIIKEAIARLVEMYVNGEIDIVPKGKK